MDGVILYRRPRGECTTLIESKRPTLRPADVPASPAVGTLAEVDLRLEVGARVGVGERLLELDLAPFEQRIQPLVEALHAALAALVDGFLDRHHVALLDQRSDVGGVQHDLHGCPPPSLLTLHQAVWPYAGQVLPEV